MTTRTRARRLVTAALLALAATGSIGAAGAQNRPSRPQRAEIDDDLPDPQKVKQWSLLAASIISEFQRRDLDLTGRIEADYSSREFHLRVNTRGEEQRVTHIVTDEELESADLQALARRILAGR